MTTCVWKESLIPPSSTERYTEFQLIIWFPARNFTSLVRFHGFHSMISSCRGQMFLETLKTYCMLPASRQAVSD